MRLERPCSDRKHGVEMNLIWSVLVHAPFSANSGLAAFVETYQSGYLDSPISTIHVIEERLAGRICIEL